jgi:uncharacterized protein
MRTAALTVVTMAFAGIASHAEGQSPPPVPLTPAPVGTHAEVRVPTTDPEVTLGGTLSVPDGDTAGALVVFLTGSGDHIRDQVISGTPMFAHMADRLVGAGFAALRLDDRGTGASTGPTTTATSTGHRVDDMRAVVRWVRDRPDLAARRLILLGHSEGAMVAAAVASREPDVGGLILLGPPARAGAEVWIDQQLAGVAQHLGRPVAELGEIREALEAVVAASVGGEGEAAIEAAGIRLFEGTGMDVEEARESGLLAGFTARVASPWFRYFLGHDPTNDYARVAVPTLAVFGDLDRLTSPALNAEPLQAALSLGGADLTLRVLADQDHFFLRSPDLPPGEHRFGRMHVAPELLDAIVEWLRAEANEGAHPSN